MQKRSHTLLFALLTATAACDGDSETSSAGGTGGSGEGGTSGEGGAGAGGEGGSSADGGEGADGGSSGDGGGGSGAGGEGGSAGDAGASGSGASGGSAGSGGEGARGGSSGTGATGGSSGSGGSSGDCSALPELLSETGLFEEDGTTTKPGVEPYTPQFELWTDAAEKRRWVSLPAGGVIATAGSSMTNMDFWNFPNGTKFWKEFVRDGVRVETRLIEKDCNGQWLFVAYLWDEDQKEARAVPEGVVNAKGTAHDVPNQEACRTCHEATPDRVLGFGALQLSHDLPGVTLDGLVSDDRLSEAPASRFTVPGDPSERAALGYLHANCGHCHNPFSPVFSRTTMELFLTTTTLGSVETTPTYLTTVERLLQQGDARWTCVVKPKSLEESALYQRMSLRSVDVVGQMPPIGTETTDAAALDVIAQWINGLPEQPEGECSTLTPSHE